MKEHIFVKQNKSKWLRYEKDLGNIESLSTSSVAKIYQDVTADLAYAQSQYPEARVTSYLNNLALSLHDYIYTPKSRDFVDSVVKFFTHDIPHNLADAHLELRLSFIIFSLFTIAGIILAMQDEHNIINVLGPEYVEMTLENIRNGVPTDVYGHSPSGNMFLYIALNNLRVDLNTYMWGIIPILGPGYILMKNGIMLGEFQTLFFLHGAGFQSMTAIWIHGAIEISSIIIGGAAGFALGFGWVFPKNYARKESLKRSGLRSVKILLSIIPLTILAAFLESFVTRLTGLPLIVKLLIILGSFAFILFYYVYIPQKIRKGEYNL